MSAKERLKILQKNLLEKAMTTLHLSSLLQFRNKKQMELSGGEDNAVLIIYEWRFTYALFLENWEY